MIAEGTRVSAAVGPIIHWGRWLEAVPEAFDDEPNPSVTRIDMLAINAIEVDGVAGLNLYADLIVRTNRHDLIWRYADAGVAACIGSLLCAIVATGHVFTVSLPDELVDQDHNLVMGSHGARANPDTTRLLLVGVDGPDGGYSASGVPITGRPVRQSAVPASVTRMGLTDIRQALPGDRLALDDSLVVERLDVLEGLLAEMRINRRLGGPRFRVANPRLGREDGGIIVGLADSIRVDLEACLEVDRPDP